MSSEKCTAHKNFRLSSEKCTAHKNFRLSSEKCTENENFTCQVKKCTKTKIFRKIFFDFLKKTLAKVFSVGIIGLMKST